MIEMLILVFMLFVLFKITGFLFSVVGKVLGCVRAETTGGFDVFKTFDCRLENTHGTHSLCFVFRSDAEEPARFEDFCFEQVRP